MEFWIGAIVYSIVCGIGAAVIANSKGRPAFPWFICGAALGFIGLLIAIGVTRVEREPEEPEPQRRPATADNARPGAADNAWRQPRVREADDSPAAMFISLLGVLVILAIIALVWLGPF